MAESIERMYDSERIYDSIKAPPFFDFNRVDDSDYENGYFEQDHEFVDPLIVTEGCENVTLAADKLENFNICKSNFRRSVSVDNLNIYSSKLRNGKNYRKSDEDNSSPITSPYRINRASSKETIARLAKPKRHYGSELNLSRTEYVPMAEAVNKFQNRTPKRFRSRPNLASESIHLPTTIPQSPKLRTIIRNRPIYALSQAEKEQLEFEEAKKAQFKANPINKKIFKSPQPGNVKVKKSTVPEPFKLTAAPKKIDNSPINKAPEFHARPVPKCVYEPKIKAPLRIPVTKPHTPSFMKRQPNSLVQFNTTKNETLRTQQEALKSTRPVPFSFEARDKQTMSKKDQLIQRVLEAEKRAREFHAKPVPKSVLQHSKAFSSKSDKSDDTMNTTSCFRAKPPSVLYKKPFEPKLEHRPLLEIEGFVLNTDVRGRQREQFDQLMKNKEEQTMILRQQAEAARQQKEAEEMQRIRKNAEFKAHEIKKYKEVVIKPSNKFTLPISPKFLSNKTKHRSGNKENTP